MKSPLLLFALKCSVILYFAACSGIADYSTAVSATPIVTKGSWKITLYTDTDKDLTNDFEGYAFTFDPEGEMRANKNGTEIRGNWAEDNISKRITINLRTDDPILAKLNDYWNISSITKTGVSLRNKENSSYGRLQMTSL